jgi:1-acyl-sn-glycerol-3-phosphate acyltransferase
MVDTTEPILERRDPAFVRRLLPIADLVTRYFRPKVLGLERLPRSGPYLLVGVHSGGVFMPDAIALIAAWLKQQGPEAELFCLSYDLLFAIPGAGKVLERFGVLPASPVTAEAALHRGAAVLVYPGGDVEDCRSWRERHHVDLAGHTGFVRLALRTGVPVVPVVSHGSHEADFIVTRGDRLARALGLDRLRVKVMPFVIGLPFGLAPIVVPHVPLPARVTVEVLEPVRWELDPADAEDEGTVKACYEQVVGLLQRALTRLAATPALPFVDPPPPPALAA